MPLWRSEKLILKENNITKTPKKIRGFVFGSSTIYTSPSLSALNSDLRREAILFGMSHAPWKAQQDIYAKTATLRSQ